LQVAQQLIQLAARREAGAGVLAARQQQFTRLQQDVLDHMHAGNAGVIIDKHMVAAQRDTQAHQFTVKTCIDIEAVSVPTAHTTMLSAR